MIAQFKVYIILGVIILTLGALTKFLYDENKTLEHNLEVTVQAYEHSLKVQEEVSFQEGINHAESLNAERVEEKVKVLLKQRGKLDEKSIDSTKYNVIAF